MIEKKTINLQIEVSIANDTTNGCLLTGKVSRDGEDCLVTHVPSKDVSLLPLDKGLLSARLASKLAVLISEISESIPYPSSSSLQEEALPPEQQGQI